MFHFTAHFQERSVHQDRRIVDFSGTYEDRLDSFIRSQLDRDHRRNFEILYKLHFLKAERRINSGRLADRRKDSGQGEFFIHLNLLDPLTFLVVCIHPSLEEITVKMANPLQMHGSVMKRPDGLKFAHFPALSKAILSEQTSCHFPLRILDVGCGSGNLPFFCQIPEECRLLGVDLWPNQLRQAAEKNSYEVLLQVNLIHGLPFRNESFDMIVCSEVLMYLPEGTEMLTEFYRVLSPGGKLLVYNPINWFPGLHSQIKRLARKIYQERRSITLDCQSYSKDSERPNRITYYSFDSLIEHIRSANFHVTEIRGFRLFRNRIRLLARLDKFDWYRRLAFFITRYYPQLASDIFVAAYKEQPRS